MWSSVPLHWLQSGAATAQQVREEVRPGSLLVLHEGQRHGPPVAELLDAIIPQLKQADLRFVTVDQLWQAPGRD
jgi:peptidoglycan/xylan/chitin deacetylase (PgdA/CDA1 family)